MNSLIQSREETTLSRIEEMKGRIAEKFGNDPKYRHICIYATGSYGRLEASNHSDIDLFFIQDSNLPEKLKVSRINKIRLDSGIIEIYDALKFPEFSNDGEFLTIHNLDDIKKYMGGRDDDFKNYFTARMLLLLESRPLHNETLYNKIIDEIVGSYYRDLDLNGSSFKPAFLVNDILRYWRTLCLNYEFRRNPSDENVADMTEAEKIAQDKRRKDKAKLNSFKLGFSRMLMCFSSISCLVAAGNEFAAANSPDNFRAIVNMKPLDRLRQAAHGKSAALALVDDIENDYAWFLESTGRAEGEMLDWIGKPDHHAEARKRSKEFGDKMYSLLTIVSATDTGSGLFRYLVV